jgi:hypothetical protein
VQRKLRMRQLRNSPTDATKETAASFAPGRFIAI